MSIKVKIIIMVLPLIVMALVITSRASDELATRGINSIAYDFLNFKTTILKENAESQWRTVVEIGKTGDETYISLTKGGIQAYATSLLQRDSEFIAAFDNQANGVMKTKKVEILEDEVAFIKELIANKTSTLVEPRLGGVDRIAVGFYFEPFDWYFLVTEEKAVFYGDINKISRTSLVILIAAIVISIIFLFYFASFLTRPLSRVSNTMRGIIQYTDLSERVQIEYKDETGELAHTFNLMIAELEKAYNQIKGYAFKAVLAQKKEKRIRQIFQKYVPKDVINQFFQNPEAMLVGENRVLSILFSDIRSFTTISEKMMPDELVGALNRYFSVMVDIIMNRNGVIDKYIGDAIMAFFGAPVKHEDDALQSVYAGLEMARALVDFNKEQEAMGFPPFYTGIGINYGIVTVGNIGSEKKMDYTVIGDMVNLASRLEGLTKKYSQGLVISESVRNKVVDQIPCRMLDKVAVKGKTRGVNIYTASLSLSKNQKQGWHYHGDAMRNYYNQDFQKAITLFEKVKEYMPGDPIADIFINRSRLYIKNPPREWNGVEIMKEK